MSFDWKSITPKEFEKLCYKLLKLDDFYNLEWYGKSGGDKGRDIIAVKEKEPLSGMKKEEKWVVQCKRFTSRTVSYDELSSFFNSCREHNPDNVLIIITNTLTANTKDWVDSVRSDYKFDIYFWEEQDLEREMLRNRTELFEQFPEIYPEEQEIELYTIDTCEIIFGCDEMMGVELRAVNVENYEEAKSKIEEFIKVIKNNNLTFKSKNN